MHIPDFTILNIDQGAHLIVDITTAAVVGAQSVHGASRVMGAAAEAQAAGKVGTYGNVQPRTLLPFVVELPCRCTRQGSSIFLQQVQEIGYQRSAVARRARVMAE